MRLIVVGDTYPQDNSTQLLQVWFRFPAKAGREPFYKADQANTQPQAPGDYAGVDAAEIQAIQNGQFVERLAPTSDVRLDPSDSTAQKQAKIVRAYNLAAAKFSSSEDARLAFWNTSFDGAAWAIKSA